MKIVRPVDVGSSELTSTNVANIEADWAAGTYNTGDRVVNDRVVWEALADGVTSEPSASVPTEWLRVGFSNKWRMFTEGRDSLSTATGSIDVTVDLGAVVSTFSALGLTGSEVQLVITDPTDGVIYDQTKSLVDIGVDDFWAWHFTDYEQDETVIFEGIPPYPAASINFIVSGATGTDPVSAGRVVTGVAKELGVTQYGSSVEILGYSTKDRDEFGNLILVPRRTITMVDYDVSVPSPRVDYVLKQLRQIDAMPSLFIGNSDTYTSTITFGVYRGATQGIDTPSISDLTLKVEEF